jgi:succinyl-diaminopimelate desuccinylase
MDVVELAQRLIACETTNPPGQELACAELLGNLLEPAGFHVRSIPLAPGRVSLCAELPPTLPVPAAGNRPALCLTGHMDTVPIGKTPWQHPPFAGVVEHGRLHGRGAVDMKGGLAAMTMAALELARTPVARTARLVLLFTADEEVACGGARSLVDSGQLPHDIGAVIVGEPTANVPIIGHKGALWLELHTTGVAAHGSMPQEGINAVVRMARAVVRLAALQFAGREDPWLGLPSVNIGTFHGGLIINAVPDWATVRVDMRSTATVSNDELLAMVQHCLHEEIAEGLSWHVLTDKPAIMTDPGHPWIQSALARMRSCLGRNVTPGTAPYVTDAAILKPAMGHPPTLILGPGDPAMAHKLDESCPVAQLVEAQQLFLALAQEWCATPEQDRSGD